MANEQPQTEQKRRTLFRSTQGPVVPGSLKETEKFVEALVQQSPNYQQTVRAYKDDQKEALRSAAASGESILVRGSLLGSKERDNVHLAVNSVNKPAAVRAEVTHVSHSSPEKQPAVNGFMKRVVEGKDGQTHKIPMPFRAFGDAAVSMAGLKVGDVFTGDAREIVVRREKDGKVDYRDAMEVLGNVQIGDPELKAEAEQDNAIDEAAFPTSDPSGFDDDIPF